jgi:flavin-dependent dehydrogenase
MRLFGYGSRASGSYRSAGSVHAPLDHGYAVRREVFDGILLDAALATRGVELYTGWRADALLRDDDGAVAGLRIACRGEESLALRAPFTIGADGLRRQA